MKLTESQFALLSRATQRDDAILELPSNLKGAAAEKVLGPLLKAKLLEEVQARPTQPVWKRDEQERPIALIITSAGLKAIHAHANERRAVEGEKEKPKPSSRPEAAKRPKSDAKAKQIARKTGSTSKQDKIVGLLRRPQGATIAGVMKATGWQQHSVRGFFAGTVRKKLKLKLTSEEAKAGRVYRIKAGRR
jgi:hypothetical protein